MNYIDRENFKVGLMAEGIDKTDNILTIDDFIKPLQYKLRAYKANLDAVFAKYDKDKNFRVSVEEIKDVLKQHNIKMSQQD
jgi:Ca2+-binding EF-hand superfamily protein